jgi:hypothetical protein
MEKVQMLFNVYDLVSGKIYATAENKGEADRKFVEVQRKHPDRKIHIKMFKGVVK